MKRKVKIVIGLVLICGFIAITSTQFISPTASIPPFEDDPEDPGNSPGPGLGSIPREDMEFRFIRENIETSTLNWQL